MAQVETRNRATSNEDSRKRVHGRIEKEGIEFVLLWFTDIEGHLKSFAVTPSEIEAALDDGMGFDGSSITGFNAIEESDMVAIPDPETYPGLLLAMQTAAQGKSDRDVADTLNAAGYRSTGRVTRSRPDARRNSAGADVPSSGLRSPRCSSSAT